jgi:hypothetical protein
MLQVLTFKEDLSPADLAEIGRRFQIGLADVWPDVPFGRLYFLKDVDHDIT